MFASFSSDTPSNQIRFYRIRNKKALRIARIRKAQKAQYNERSIPVQY
ncbi:MAG: hypothetical protein H6Q64_1321 [Firmicutes bacterium]|nr:hypothetical protein [Bacillota bacterium]